MVINLSTLSAQKLYLEFLYSADITRTYFDHAIDEFTAGGFGREWTLTADFDRPVYFERFELGLSYYFTEKVGLRFRGGDVRYGQQSHIYHNVLGRTDSTDIRAGYVGQRHLLEYHSFELTTEVVTRKKLKENLWFLISIGAGINVRERSQLFGVPIDRDNGILRQGSRVASTGKRTQGKNDIDRMLRIIDRGEFRIPIHVGAGFNYSPLEHIGVGVFGQLRYLTNLLGDTTAINSPSILNGSILAFSLKLSMFVYL